MAKGRLQKAIEQQARNLRQTIQRARDYFSTQIDHLTGKHDSSEKRLFQRTYDEKGKNLRRQNTNFSTYANKRKENLTSRLGSNKLGRLMMFAYSPKHAETLPYYDRLPLILLMEIYPDGRILGLNLHYLPPKMRAILLDAIVDNEIKNQYKEKDRIRFSYKIMKTAARNKLFEPCVKQYIVKGNYVKSRFLEIPPEEWEEILFLPYERFEKQDKQHVWRESLRKIRRNK